MRLIDVQGWCPMGCGRTLHLNMDTGQIFCINRKCSRPLAVTELISREGETHHTVAVRAGDFEIKHPLMERVTGSLLDCLLQRWLNGLDGPPVVPGTYHVKPFQGSTMVTGHDVSVFDNWLFEKKPDERF